MDRYERVERVDYKSARDVVTEVDHLSEELIIAAIRARFPDDGILAEESGEHVAVAGEAPSSGQGRTWIVDPVDGTINYANGIPFFCVSIGLAVDGRPAVGCRPRSESARDVCGHRRRTGHARGPRGRGLGEGEAERLRGPSRARRAAARDPDAPDPQGDPGRADDGLGGTRHRVRRRRAVRCLRPGGRPVELGHRRRRPDRRAQRCSRHGDGRRPWFDIGRGPVRSA